MLKVVLCWLIKVPRRVYKGIPDRWRSAAWATLMRQFVDPDSKGKGRATDEELGIMYKVRLVPFVLGYVHALIVKRCWRITLGANRPSIYIRRTDRSRCTSDDQWAYPVSHPLWDGVSSLSLVL